MKNSLLLICLLIVVNSQAQIDFVKHDFLLLSAERQNRQNQFEEALQLYEQAFKINGANSVKEYLDAANCAAKLNKKQTCKKWIEAAIIYQKAEEKTIASFHKTKLYIDCASEILPKYDHLLAQYYNAIENPLAYFEIQKLLYRDQFSRKLSEYHLGITEEDQEAAFDGYLQAQADKDSMALTKYKNILWPVVNKEHKAYERQIMRFTDSLNILKLMEITKVHGWQEEALLLLWHQRGSYGEQNWVWNYFKPLIDKEIAAGKLKQSFWAQFEDISSIYKTGKSLYGYHPGKVDPNTVNEKRKSIGLPLLTDAEIDHRNNNPYGGRMY
ncbi:hypothetical protein N9B82_05830 [Saprospiraceae bacterium]|nr:hypothetical protein [Saprospiraceae bacterium]